MPPAIIVGFGDVGQRIARQLASAQPEKVIIAVSRTVNTDPSLPNLLALSLDLDHPVELSNDFNQAEVYYLAPPQKSGVTDLRSKQLISAFDGQNISPSRVVLISTTGVYGDHQGEWVSETSRTVPQTERGKRRLDSEQQWARWSERTSIPLNILRVPGIYANSRLPRQRLAQATPVVRAEECGFSNRIHADDLALVAISAMQSAIHGEVFNVTDGTPGKISEYLQEAAKVLALPPLPEISMSEARTVLSSGMLSYLSESRKISNQKMLDKLKVALSYPDYRVGLRH